MVKEDISGSIHRISNLKLLFVFISVLSLVLLSFNAFNCNPTAHATVVNSVPYGRISSGSSSYYYPGYSYNGQNAVSYARLIDQNYYHSSTYPSGTDATVFQKNLDHYGSEDCAHFVSEALISGGLSSLSSNPPGDNLTGYDHNNFVGSYGIVGVYRLADYLAGYDLPVFPVNATDEQTIGYQPIPASYYGSPHASVYYVTNDSMFPSYFLSPGDVIVDGGAGNGHATLYAGNGTVIQTDPANMWQYDPGIDYNISFYGLLTLEGQNVSALYMHMPTISPLKTVRITGIIGDMIVNSSQTTVPGGSRMLMIASFPDGVGFGNYTYLWKDNGVTLSASQSFNLPMVPGKNEIEVESTGSNGTAYANVTLYNGEPGLSIFGLDEMFSLSILAISVILAVTGIVVYVLKKR